MLNVMNMNMNMNMKHDDLMPRKSPSRAENPNPLRLHQERDRGHEEIQIHQYLL